MKFILCPKKRHAEVLWEQIWGEYLDRNREIRGEVKKIPKPNVEFYNLCSSFHQELRISSRRWAGSTALLKSIKIKQIFLCKTSRKATTCQT